MESNGYSLSDVVAAMGGNNGAGSGMGLLMIVILFLFVVMFMGGTGRNQGYQPQYATQQDVQNTAQYGNLLDGNRDISNLVTAGTAQAVAATNQSFHDSLNVIQDKYNEITRDIAAVQVSQTNALANQNQCCCETKMLIQQAAADNALQMAQMEARLNAKMDANEIQNLRDQIGQLQLNQATAGMLRFPDSWTYGAGLFPPIYGGCPGQGNI
jgi:hypothetical protein